MVVGGAGGIVPVDEAHHVAFVFHEFNRVAIIDVREEFSQCGADFIFPVLPEIVIARVSGRKRKHLAGHGQQNEQCSKRLGATSFVLVAHAELHVIDLDRSLPLDPDRNIVAVLFRM